MNVNITLPTTMTCVARRKRLERSREESEELPPAGGGPPRGCGSAMPVLQQTSQGRGDRQSVTVAERANGPSRPGVWDAEHCSRAWAAMEWGGLRGVGCDR